MSIETKQKKWVIAMEGSIPFFVSDVKYNGDPSFTANLDEALKCRSCAGAFIELEKIKKAGFTMNLKVHSLQIQYTLGEK